jgi:hypothetical protein
LHEASSTAGLALRVDLRGHEEVRRVYPEVFVEPCEQRLWLRRSDGSWSQCSWLKGQVFELLRQQCGGQDLLTSDAEVHGLRFPRATPQGGRAWQSLTLRQWIQACHTPGCYQRYPIFAVRLASAVDREAFAQQQYEWRPPPQQQQEGAVPQQQQAGSEGERLWLGASNSPYLSTSEFRFDFFLVDRRVICHTADGSLFHILSDLRREGVLMAPAMDSWGGQLPHSVPRAWLGLWGDQQLTSPIKLNRTLRVDYVVSDMVSSAATQGGGSRNSNSSSGHICIKPEGYFPIAVTHDQLVLLHNGVAALAEYRANPPAYVVAHSSNDPSERDRAQLVMYVQAPPTCRMGSVDMALRLRTHSREGLRWLRPALLSMLRPVCQQVLLDGSYINAPPAPAAAAAPAAPALDDMAGVIMGPVYNH